MNELKCILRCDGQEYVFLSDAQAALAEKDKEIGRLTKERDEYWRQRDREIADNQRLREALQKAHTELAKAQLGEEYEPDVEVLSVLERVTGWNGSSYEQALAQTAGEGHCAKCGQSLPVQGGGGK